VIRALVTGAGGQVGAQVVRELSGRAEVIALDRAGLDLADASAVRARLREAQPHLIVNAAAYTAVDRAESQESLALAVNGAAPGVMAEEARRTGALLVHFSTDYVFDGTKAGAYLESDATHPLNAYGRTKLEGERRIAASGCPHVVLRTSWVYGPRGSNFVLTMLRLARARDELRVVDDQHGAPTSSLQLARAVRRLLVGGDSPRAVALADLERLARSSGLYHATAAGETTWHGFATAIFAAAPRSIAPRTPRVVPIPTRDYPTPARRPANSVLGNAKLRETFGVELEDWRAGLAETLSAVEG